MQRRQSFGNVSNAGRMRRGFVYQNGQENSAGLRRLFENGRCGVRRFGQRNAESERRNRKRVRRRHGRIYFCLRKRLPRRGEGAVYDLRHRSACAEICVGQLVEQILRIYRRGISYAFKPLQGAGNSAQRGYGGYGLALFRASGRTEKNYGKRKKHGVLRRGERLDGIFLEQGTVSRL